jgi:hypothetical protein
MRSAKNPLRQQRSDLYLSGMGYLWSATAPDDRRHGATASRLNYNVRLAAKFAKNFIVNIAAILEN